MVSQGICIRDELLFAMCWKESAEYKFAAWEDLPSSTSFTFSWKRHCRLTGCWIIAIDLIADYCASRLSFSLYSRLSGVLITVGRRHHQTALQIVIDFVSLSDRIQRSWRSAAELIVWRHRCMSWTSSGVGHDGLCLLPALWQRESSFSICHQGSRQLWFERGTVATWFRIILRILHEMSVAHSQFTEQYSPDRFIDDTRELFHPGLWLRAIPEDLCGECIFTKVVCEIFDDCMALIVSVNSYSMTTSMVYSSRQHFQMTSESTIRSRSLEKVVHPVVRGSRFLDGKIIARQQAYSCAGKYYHVTMFPLKRHT